jgi:phosphoglycerate dehydrogenase-like enzyme
MFGDILVLLPEHAAKVHGDLIRSELRRLLPEARLRIVCDEQSLTDSADVDVIVAPQVPWLHRAIAACPGLRWLHLLTAGAELVFEAGLQNGAYWISKSSGVNAPAVAEYVIAAILYFSKRLDIFAQQQQRREWRRYWLDELAGKQITILGLGSIGLEIAKRASAIGFRTVGVSRKATPVPWVDVVLPGSSLVAAVNGSAVLAVAVPLTPQTRGLVGASVLGSLEPGAIVIDVSRGGVLVHDDLIPLLTEGRLRGAALDVFDKEPLPRDSELWRMPNVLVTPHVAGTTDLFMERALRVFARNLKSLTENNRLATPVDLDAGY